MKRALFVLIAWLALVPSARADWISFDVMAGSITRIGGGSGSGDLFLLRDDFWVHTGGQAAGCRGVVLSGRPIASCSGGNSLTPFMYFMGGTSGRGGWFGLDGIEHLPLAADSHLSLTGGPPFVSGAARPVLSDPLASCPQTGCTAIQPSYKFAIDGLYSVEVPLEEEEEEEYAMTVESVIGEEFEAGDEFGTTQRTANFAQQTPGAVALLSLALVGLVGLLVCGRYLKPR